ncbi:MAG: hypothetical protein ACRDAM_01990, partial [Casimicrobium sp.]
ATSTSTGPSATTTTTNPTAPDPITTKTNTQTQATDASVTAKITLPANAIKPFPGESATSFAARAGVPRSTERSTLDSANKVALGLSMQGGTPSSADRVSSDAWLLRNTTNGIVRVPLSLIPEQIRPGVVLRMVEETRSWSVEEKIDFAKSELRRALSSDRVPGLATFGAFDHHYQFKGGESAAFVELSTAFKWFNDNNPAKYSGGDELIGTVGGAMVDAIRATNNAAHVTGLQQGNQFILVGDNQRVDTVLEEFDRAMKSLEVEFDKPGADGQVSQRYRLDPEKGWEYTTAKLTARADQNGAQLREALITKADEITQGKVEQGLYSAERGGQPPFFTSQPVPNDAADNEQGALSISAARTAPLTEQDRRLTNSWLRNYVEQQFNHIAENDPDKGRKIDELLAKSLRLSRTDDGLIENWASINLNPPRSGQAIASIDINNLGLVNKQGSWFAGDTLLWASNIALADAADAVNIKYGLQGNDQVRVIHRSGDEYVAVGDAQHVAEVLAESRELLASVSFDGAVVNRIRGELDTHLSDIGFASATVEIGEGEAWQ